jgi:hypothetical protein
MRQCAQPGHCQKGMAMSINANESSTHNTTAFIELAMLLGPIGASRPPTTPMNPLSAYATNSRVLASSESSSADYSHEVLNRLNAFAPAIIGLLAGAIILLLVLVGITVFKYARGTSQVRTMYVPTGVKESHYSDGSRYSEQ